VKRPERVATVQTLLNRGVNSSIPDIAGQAALQWAWFYGHGEVPGGGGARAAGGDSDRGMLIGERGEVTMEIAETCRQNERRS
jgi:hypothetical protein